VVGDRRIHRILQKIVNAYRFLMSAVGRYSGRINFMAAKRRKSHKSRFHFARSVPFCGGNVF
jgi:hypothetical protein